MFGCVLHRLGAAGIAGRDRRDADLAAGGRDRGGRATLHPIRLLDRFHQVSSRPEPQSRSAPRVPRASRRTFDSSHHRLLRRLCRSAHRTDAAPPLQGEPGIVLGNADQRMDFTTMDDTAAFVASAALDPSTPRFLRIAGDQVSARELTVIASEVTAKRFHLLRPGGLGMLSALIEIARAVAPEETELYPGLAGYAVHAQHVRRSSKAAAARQRSLSRNALDARARGDLSAPGEFLNHSGSCDEPCLCLMQPKESNTWQPVTT